MNTQAEGKVPMVHACSHLHSSRDGSWLNRGLSLEGYQHLPTPYPIPTPHSAWQLLSPQPQGPWALPIHLCKHLVGPTQSPHFKEEDSEFRGR